MKVERLKKKELDAYCENLGIEIKKKEAEINRSCLRT